MRGELCCMTKSLRHIVIGCITLILGLGGWYGFFIPKSEPKASVYSGYFRSVDGLKIGAPVYVFGIPIGTVSHMVLDKGRVRVDVMMDTPIDIPLDSSLQVQTLGLFSEKSLAIGFGFEYDTLQPNDTFMYTENAVDVIQLLNTQLDRNIEKRENMKKVDNNES